MLQRAGAQPLSSIKLSTRPFDTGTFRCFRRTNVKGTLICPSWTCRAENREHSHWLRLFAACFLFLSRLKCPCLVTDSCQVAHGNGRGQLGPSRGNQQGSGVKVIFASLSFAGESSVAQAKSLCSAKHVLRFIVAVSNLCKATIHHLTDLFPCFYNVTSGTPRS